MNDPSDTIDGTTLNVADLALIGMSLLNLASASEFMRHATPAGTTDYAEPGTGADRLVSDFAIWCGAGSHHKEARERVLAYLNRSGWSDFQLQALTESAVA